MATISWADFEKLDLRAGIVVRVEDFPEARKPAYKLWVDFGPLGVKPASAQLAPLYTREDLTGRQVIGVVNLPPKRIAGFASEVLVLGVPDNQARVVLLDVEREVPPGGRVF